MTTTVSSDSSTPPTHTISQSLDTNKQAKAKTFATQITYTKKTTCCYEGLPPCCMEQNIARISATNIATIPSLIYFSRQQIGCRAKMLLLIVTP